MTRAPVVLTLPQGCPLCRTLLQRDLAAGASVAPHFEACHPGLPVPAVRQEVSR